MNFDDFFKTATGYTPFNYQSQLAVDTDLPDAMHIPTGLGKTTVIVVWLWRKLFHPEKSVRDSTPRRLIYCLPMRTLVRQTRDCAGVWIRNLLNSEILSVEVPVNIIMGGETTALKGWSWDSSPEIPQIIIGTQDQLISRALNRGYAMSRYRWPAHFALMNNDALWIMDEIQLMGNSLSTSLQLDGFRKKLGCFGPVHTLWMSATLSDTALTSVDHPVDGGLRKMTVQADSIEPYSIAGRRLNAAKPLKQCPVSMTRDSKNTYAADLTQFITTHARPEAGEMTLIIVNQVKRALELHKRVCKAMAKDDHTPEIILLHSRFRPADRAAAESLLTTPPGTNGRMVISTQVVEAGVDIDASTLITELAPWSSLVQRFGRCNRRGRLNADHSSIFWIDIDSSLSNDVLPYSEYDLNQARKRIGTIDNAVIKEIMEISLPGDSEIPMVIRQRELRDLFDTTPDLAGWDIDISRYIRESRDLDVHVFWRDWEKATVSASPQPPPEDMSRPHQSELCAVPVSDWAAFYKKIQKKHASMTPAWIWSPLDKKWVPYRPEHLRPGIRILLNVKMGGYDPLLGWKGDPKNPVVPLDIPDQDPPDAMGQDKLTDRRQWETIAGHTGKVQTAMNRLLDRFPAIKTEFPDFVVTALQTAVLWHDVGKAHPAFQNRLTQFQDPPEDHGLWAKTPQTIPASEYRMDKENPASDRRYFRHELVSALAILNAGESDLAAYLTAAHHGRIRTAIRSIPGERTPPGGKRFALGVWDGDAIPDVPLPGGKTAPPFTVDLSLMELGESRTGPSWIARIQALLDTFGPFQLAWFEYLMRVADWRGSDPEGDN